MVGGYRARLARPVSSADSCRDVGGAVELVGTVVPPVLDPGVLQMSACFGPDAGAAALTKAGEVFQSLRFSASSLPGEGSGLRGASARLARSLVVP